MFKRFVTRLACILFGIMCLGVTNVMAGSLNWSAYSISNHAPNVESSCFNNGSYLSTCNNTNWAYVNSTPVATGTMTSLNHNWNNSNITPDGSTSVGLDQRMLVITGYWQHPGTPGQTSTVYFAGRNDDGFIVNINNTAVISDWAQQGPTYWNSNGSFTGVGGRWYPIVINWYEWGGSANLDLHYSLSNLSLSTTTGWLDMNSDYFTTTDPRVQMISAPTSAQLQSRTDSRNITTNGNDIYIQQSGDNLDLDIVQYDKDQLIAGTSSTNSNLTDATITGDDNTVSITQGNSAGSFSDNNVTLLDITGNNNSLTVRQGDNVDDTGGHRSSTNVVGNYNTLGILQENDGGIGSAGHYMELDVAGNSNTAHADQKDDGDKILFLDVDGNSNTIDILQQGTGEHFLDVTAGSNQTIDINQDGSGSHSATIDMSGYSSTLDLDQTGTIDQTYSLNQICTNVNGCGTTTINQQ